VHILMAGKMTGEKEMKMSRDTDSWGINWLSVLDAPGYIFWIFFKNLSKIALIEIIKYIYYKLSI